MSTSPAAAPAVTSGAGARRDDGRLAWWGLAIGALLVVLAFAIPPLTGWEVWPRAPRSRVPGEVPPLHGFWQPKPAGPGTPAVLALAALGVAYGGRVAARLSWRGLLLTSYVVALGWLLALALVDGPDGLSRQLGSPDEYLPTARAVGDVSTLLHTYVERIPYAAAPDNWPTHVAGHPPLALLFFVGLVRIGLGGDLAAGVVVTVLAASTAPAVLATLRSLGAEPLARRAAPFLVLTPAAVFTAVSADGLFAAVAAWGLAALAWAASTAARTGAGAGAWAMRAALAGLLLGALVLLSYGMPLLGVIALAVVVAAGPSWRAGLGVVATAGCAAMAVVVGFAVAGFSWLEAYPVLTQRYWDGIAHDRPAGYWVWGNLAALLVSGGVVLAASVAPLTVRARAVVRAVLSTGDAAAGERAVVLLAGAAWLAVLAADASQMSKAEVERIWLPFLPWLTLGLVLLPDRWQRPALLAQVAGAVVVQHLLYTTW